MAAAPARAADCSNLGPPDPVIASTQKRLVTARDLVRLRDVGWPASVALDGPSAIAASPDGGSVAFQIRRADPDTNSYCIGMFVASTSKGGPVIEIDHGGDLIFASLNRTGITDFPSGVPLVITPHWSPDGKWIAFLKRSHGVTQVWKARADGSGSEEVSRSGVDVEDLAWSPDGESIIFSSRPALAAIRASVNEEGQRGYHYDGRFVPKASSEPFPLAPIATAYSSLDLVSHQVRPATSEEQALLTPDASHRLAQNTSPHAGIQRAWIYARDPTRYVPTSALAAISLSGQRADCRTDVCSHIVGLWWARNRHDILFLRYDGWASSKLGLYKWTPGVGSPTRLFATDDMLANCQLLGDQLLCLHEAASSPRELVTVNLSGEIRTLLRLNPEFDEIRLGSIERLKWRNAMGIDTFADLVLPPRPTHGPLPLIIVQYDSRGFLRGGTGDEYPIQLFAANGFAVLSFERPREVGLSMPSRNGDELERSNMVGWADLRSVLSSLERVITMLVDHATVDPRRIGITGLSDGARTVQYALQNSTLFAAAAVSSSFEGSETLIPLAGPAAEDSYIASGYPRRPDVGRDFWTCYSLSQNGPGIRSPVLMQLADDEYLGSLEVFSAFRSNHVPTALYVFPKEHHIKWQPAHRMAIYQRNLAWFEYWLDRDHMDVRFVERLFDRADLARWNQLAAIGSESEPATPVQCRAQASASANASTRR